MSLTVAQVLELDLLRQACPEVVAGVRGLSRKVRWVHISEQPDVARFLKGGELLFTTGMGLGLNATLHRRFVDDLADANIAGLLIRLGGTWKTTPIALVEHAEARDVPTIVLHRRIGAVELTEQVNGAIISWQLELLRKAESIAKGFTDLVVQGAGLRRILRRLAQIVGNPVVLEDPAHQLIDFAVHNEPAAHILTAWESHSRLGHGDGEMGREMSAFGSPPCMWANVSIRGQLWGRLHVLESERSLDEIDELALDRAVAAVALALLNEAEIKRLASHARNSLIADIRSDRYGGANDFYRRADGCRADFRELQLAVLTLAPLGLHSRPSELDMSENERLNARYGLVYETQSAIESAAAVGLCGLDGDQVLSIVGVARSRDLQDTMTAVGEDICRRVTRLHPDVTPVVGISSEASPHSLQRAFDQALEAVAYGRGRGSACVVRFADLGLQHLLLRLSDGPELARFVESELSPLLEHDARRKTALVTTLRVYLDCGNRKSLAAKSLAIERRSLYHRLDRIKKTLQADIDDQETALRLRLALRGLDLLRQRAPVGLEAQR